MIGWAANILLIVSMWLVGSKKRICFIFGVWGNFLWMVVGFQRETPDLWFIALVMVIFNARGWFKWRKAQ